MVQILPSQKNLGSKIGESLGMGLQQGLGTGLNQAYQSGKLQDVFNQLKGNENDPVKIAQALAQSAIYSPNAERTMAAVAPLLLNRARAQNLYGEGENAENVSQENMERPGNVPDQFSEETPNAQTNVGIGKNASQQSQLGGFLPNLKTPQQIEQAAANRAVQFGDPNEYVRGLELGQAENRIAEESYSRISNLASQLPGMNAEKLPIFMQIAKQKYGHLNDPNEIITQTNKDYRAFENLRNSLKDAFIPGAVRGAFQKIPGGGVLGSLIAKGPARDQALNRLNPVAKGYVDLGFEHLLREDLRKEHLSPTEIEQTIHPLSQQTIKNIDSLPNGDQKKPAEIKQKQLIDFFKKNVTPDSSLLVLRHKLWNDKNYDWNEVSEALQQAMNQGLKLTTSQQTELPEFTTQAPRQSLSDVFQGYGRWIDYLRGNK